MRLKKLCAAVLAAVMLFGAALPARAALVQGQLPTEADSFAGDGLLFTELEDGTYEVGYDYSGAKPTGVLVIPEEVNGIAVTRIACGGFSGCDRITDVILPDTIVSAGENAFLGTPFQDRQEGDIKYAGRIAVYCEEEATNVEVKEGTLGLADKLFHLTPSLETAKLPESLVNLGFMAFDSCDKLTAVNIPNGITTIDSGAFYGCSALKDITIPNGVTSIGTYAFAGSGITSVTLPAGLTKIGKGAFENCAELTEKSVTTANDGYIDIGARAFYGTPFLDKQEGVAYLGSVVIGAERAIEKAELKAGTTAIADMAFAGCENLKSVVIPAGVLTIGEDAFYDCAALKSAVIPEGVTEIREDAFRLCTSLAEISLPQSVKLIEEGAFYGDTALKSVSFGGSAADWAALSLGIENEPLLKPVPQIALNPKIPSAVKELHAGLITGNSAELVWTAGENADSYEISVLNNEGKWEKIGFTNGTVYIVNGLVPLTEHTFGVTALARNIRGETADVTVKTSENTVAPDTVKGFAGIPTSRGVLLSWEKNAFADSYQVDILKGNNWSRLIKTEDNSVTSYNAKNLSPNTEYVFRIFAFKGSLYSKPEKITVVTTAPPVNEPQTVTDVKSAADDSSVTLMWTKTYTANDYEVDVYKNGKWTCAGKTEGDFFTVAGLEPETSYNFRIFSLRNGKFSPSAKLTVKTAEAIAPPSVTELKAAPSEKSVKLTWNASPNADKYQVDMLKNGKWTFVEKTEACECTVSGLSPETVYQFRVYAFRKGKYNPSVRITAETSKSTAAPSKPDTVTGLKASADSESITLSWNKTATADSYEVDMYKNGKWTFVAETTDNTYKVTGLSANTSYQFRVFSFKGALYSASAKLTASTASPDRKPDTVTGLKASATANSITLSWNKTSTADSYEVDIYKNGKWTYAAKIKGNSYTVSGLSAQTSYNFRVFSFRGSLYSPSAKLTVSTASASVPAKPATVTGLKGVSSSDSITLSWNKTATADSYEIDMYKNGKWTYVVKTTGTSYTVKGLAPGTSYNFRVFSFKGKEYSRSAGVSVSTAAKAPVPLTVTGLKASADTNSISLTWNKTDTADEYEVDVKLNGKWTYIGKTKGSSFRITGLASETSYDIRVFSLKGSNFSPSAKLTYSTAVSVTQSYAAGVAAAAENEITVKPPVNSARVKIKGIDVSGWQGDIDFKKIKLQGIDFVIIKAGYETTTVTSWEPNYEKARHHGLDVGAYWYSYAVNSDEAALEALACIEALKGKRFEYPIYYDMEEQDQFDQGRAVCTQLTDSFCGTLEKAGYCAGVYSSKHWYLKLVDDDMRMKRPNWIAQYYDRCYYTGAFGIWQYGYEPLDGVESDECDVNFAYFDYAAYIRAYGLNGQAAK